MDLTHTPFSMLKRAFRDSLPILAGYTTMGFAAGVVISVQSGLSFASFWSLLAAIAFFSGTQHFVIAGMFRDGAALLDAALVTFAISFRYAFYGFSVFGRWRDFPFFQKLYLIFGLADENFALEVSCPVKDTREYRRYCLILTSLNWSYWITGCTLGAIAGERLPIPDKGIEFVMAALFVTILTDQCRALVKGDAK